MAKVDLTVVAIPGYIGAMVAEWAWQRRHPAAPGTTRTGDYELKDTIASLSMGVGSLVAPLLTQRLLDPVTPGRGRWGKALLGATLAAGVAVTVGDVIRMSRANGGLPAAGTLPTQTAVTQTAVTQTAVTQTASVEDTAKQAAAALTEPAEARQPSSPDRTAGPRPPRTYAAMAVAAVAGTALSAATVWATATSGKALFERHTRDLGTGAAATVIALLGWDAIYYWNHRLSHESRWLWAVHVVHHSSERYNLSTALRQPVFEGVTLTVPYGLLALLGVRPSVIENARALNLIYQFWIHTEVVRSIGWLEKVLNTPSHHRVHHGSNREYLDRNHGSILIIWDKLFGTFEPEAEPVVYGLTRDIETFNPLRIATHEWRDIATDIAGSQTWSDRFGFLLRGPGWAYERRAEIAAA